MTPDFALRFIRYTRFFALAFTGYVFFRYTQAKPITRQTWLEALVVCLAVQEGLDLLDP